MSKQSDKRIIHYHTLCEGCRQMIERLKAKDINKLDNIDKLVDGIMERLMEYKIAVVRAVDDDHHYTGDYSIYLEKND